MYILNVLQDAIINAYWPGHIVLIGGVISGSGLISGMTSNEFLCWSQGFCKVVRLKFWGIYIFFLSFAGTFH